MSKLPGMPESRERIQAFKHFEKGYDRLAKKMRQVHESPDVADTHPHSYASNKHFSALEDEIRRHPDVAAFTLLRIVTMIHGLELRSAIAEQALGLEAFE